MAYKALPLKEWMNMDNPNKQYYMLTWLYCIHASDVNIYEKGKMSIAFRRINGFFRKCDQCKSVYDFLYQYQGDKFSNLTSMFNAMNRYQQEKRFSPKIKEQEKYKEIGLQDVLNL